MINNKYDLAKELYHSYIATVQYNIKHGGIQGTPVSVLLSHMQPHHIGVMLQKYHDTNKIEMHPLLIKHIDNLGSKCEITYDLSSLMQSLLIHNSFGLFATYNNEIVEGHHRFMALSIMYLMELITNKTKILTIEKDKGEYTLLLSTKITSALVRNIVKKMPVLKPKVQILLSHPIINSSHTVMLDNEEYKLFKAANSTDILFLYHQIAWPLLKQSNFFESEAPFNFIDYDFIGSKDQALETLQKFNTIGG